MRTAEEIKADIKNVELHIFYEEMADFMNWAEYRKLRGELAQLKKELEELDNA